MFTQCKCKHLANVKHSELFSFVCAVISTIACIFTFTCTTYCNRASTDIKEQCNNDNGEQFRLFPNEQHILTRNTDLPPDAEHESVPDFREMDSLMSDADASVATKFDKEEIFQPYVSYSKSTEKKLLRIRRAAAADFKICRKNCKGTRSEMRKCKRGCRKSFGRKDKPKVIIVPTQVNLPAVHFEANVKDIPTQDLVTYVYTKTKNNDEGPLRIFKEADWVGDSSPAELTKDSVAVVKASGIFLVYAQVFIGGNEEEKSISVVHKKDNRPIDRLSCYNRESTLSLTTDHTCSVSGLMKLDQGDTVEVQRSLVTKDIELDKDKTFFGLVQLSGITLK